MIQISLFTITYKRVRKIINNNLLMITIESRFVILYLIMLLFLFALIILRLVCVTISAVRICFDSVSRKEE